MDAELRRYARWENVSPAALRASARERSPARRVAALAAAVRAWRARG